jgi:hypothetical protein
MWTYIFTTTLHPIPLSHRFIYTLMTRFDCRSLLSPIFFLDHSIILGLLCMAVAVIFGSIVEGLFLSSRDWHQPAWGWVWGYVAVTSVREGISPTNILMGSVPRSEQGHKSPETRKSRERCIVGGLIRYIFESRRTTARGARGACLC